MEDPKLKTGDWDDVSLRLFPDTYSILKLVSVTHNDRDIEFSPNLNVGWKTYNEGTLDPDYKSCEMMSDDSIIKSRKIS